MSVIEMTDGQLQARRVFLDLQIQASSSELSELNREFERRDWAHHAKEQEEYRATQPQAASAVGSGVTVQA